MDLFKIAVKIFVEEDRFDGETFVPIFHRWIQNQVVEDHLLIDVADYAHVVGGPGTVLVGSQGNFYMDRGENRLGLLYTRKKPGEGDFRARLRGAIVTTLKAGVILEQEPSLAGKIKFRGNEIVIRLNDRLIAPSTGQTWEAVKQDVEAIAGELFAGKSFQAAPSFGKQTVLEVRIKSFESAPIKSLLDRLAAGAPAPS